MAYIRTSRRIGTGSGRPQFVPGGQACAALQRRLTHVPGLAEALSRRRPLFAASKASRALIRVGTPA